MQVSRSLFADLKIPDTDEPILPDFMPLDAPLQPTLSDVVSDKVSGLVTEPARRVQGLGRRPIGFWGYCP